MESHLSEESVWAEHMAARLRSLQASFADDPASTRQNYLVEEMDRGLKEVPPSKRPLYLNALSECFPAWQAPAAPADEATSAQVPPTPDALLAQLIEMAPGLTPEAKTEFGQRLQQAGFAVALPSNPFSELSLDVQKKLGLGPNQALNAERAIKMLAGLLELVLALDQLSWTLWRQIARQPKFQKESDFSKLAGPYLGGDPEVSSQLVAQPLERTRRLIAALLGAVGRAGATYARKHAAHFSPEIIEDSARMGKRRLMENMDSACWRKYCELYKDHASEDAIENEIQEGMAKAAENLILGRNAG